MDASFEPVTSKPYHVRFDNGRHHRAKLGFVVLAMEQTVEDDVYKLVPPGVGVHFSRVPMSNDATLDTLRQMAGGIEGAAGLLLPDDDLDACCFTCNCGVMVIGEEPVMASLKRAKPEAEPTTVMTGVVRALRAVGAKRIVVGTPYLDEVNTHVRAFLASKGFDIADIQGLNLRTNKEIDTVEPEFLLEFGASIDRPDADALFICCGALRSLDIVDALEKRIGKPVIVSNQAMMWDCLRRAGIDDVIEGYGRLFQLRRRDAGLEG
ncbi:MAG: hypothetical protein AB7L41_05450 [Flavobacteriaceae bacterium]